MATNRRYGDGCAIASALDYVGERWALLVVRELLLGPKRFTDLQDGLPGAGSKVLAQRLRELEAAGVVRRRTLPPPASSQVYELTEWGARLDAVVVALGLWGAGAAVLSEDPVGADAAMIKLRSFFNPQPEQPWTATYEIRLGRYRFTIRVGDGRLVEMSRGEPREPDTVIETDPGTLDRVVGAAGALAEAVEQGRLTLTGDGEAGRRLFDAVRLPTSA
ncbi:winged helix-turn-helix transcriptional regulator [Saccharothrix sp. NRRL B-16314]|uniref:winged helix-turn-helix transcriptional regulator n=1 Tax=Saccharothrix sp. NRRL B-16314 TaxID=1463825 RepID=UPI000525218A|nr:helix-turn-helix domain-containing protein [Saccharothrix sp. NRRL B-16314]